jgi:hypothetical protein
VARQDGLPRDGPLLREQKDFDVTADDIMDALPHRGAWRRSHRHWRNQVSKTRHRDRSAAVSIALQQHEPSPDCGQLVGELDRDWTIVATRSSGTEADGDRAVGRPCLRLCAQGIDDDVSQYEPRIAIATAAARSTARGGLRRWPRVAYCETPTRLRCAEGQRPLRAGRSPITSEGEPPGRSPIGRGFTCCATRRSPCSRTSPAQSSGGRF